ncbi:MAG: hypothetical protein M3345_02105 [Actinomycetota bacterium]|nr:hypothetical protein [Actinomycetota bacterium]
MRRKELEHRLGGFRIGAGRELDALTEAIGAEPIAAAFIGVMRRRSWLFAATERELHVSRRPRLLGRSERRSWPWAKLQSVRSGAQRVDLLFGDERVTVSFISPQDEYVRLLETARRRSPGPSPGTGTDEIRDRAKAQVGDLLAFGFEATIDCLPDRLLEDERVHRVAGASLDFDGLLFVTDRRVLLFNVGLTDSAERLWSADRSDIRSATAVDQELRLDLGEDEVTLTDVRPDGRAGELASELGGTER